MIATLPTPDQYMDDLMTIVGLTIAQEMAEDEGRQMEMRILVNEKIKDAAAQYGAIHAAMQGGNVHLFPKPAPKEV